MIFTVPSNKLVPSHDTHCGKSLLFAVQAAVNTIAHFAELSQLSLIWVKVLGATDFIAARRHAIGRRHRCVLHCAAERFVCL